MSTPSPENPSPPSPAPPEAPEPRYRVGFLPKLEGPARDQAIAEPGPTWGEWLIGPFAKVWLALAFFIADSWVFVLWAVPFDPYAMVGSLAAALYLEFLCWRFLWFAPDREDDLKRLPFRPRWSQLTRFGRWTPQGARLRAGQDPYETEVPQDMTEFVG